MVKRPLRLLASKNNERGDLFTRLVSDLFYSLGYDDLRFDVHKTGREIDIEGKHRHEPRIVIAECKAHAAKMGGSDLNKILGAVTRERDKGLPVSGYFVSLGGFTESALEQEQDCNEQTRIIPIDAKGVIDELTRSNILIAQGKAIERAGRCAEFSRLGSDFQVGSSELLGHSLGYIWAIYYENGKEITHFSLVHADGNPLSETAAKEVIEADRKCNGSLNKLTYLAPPISSPDRKTLSSKALEHYRNWLNTVCGYIQLDGLPAEGTIASKQMTLENLFVPLKLQIQGDNRDDESIIDPEVEIYPVGEFIAQHNRFSILAKPGGGKSTLLKRLAVAYADPDRRRHADDGLPDRDWLPLLLRCRDLRARTNVPIRELLCDLGYHAEMNEMYANAFRGLVDDALNSGRALLLIDGLDEFSDASVRTTFANNLRVFLGMYPHTALVVTSREAGFRQVAGVIASICESTTMAHFDEDDVHKLCKSWHAEVLPDTQENREDAEKLADTIWSNERIRALTENPLMLTTLLVVKRNVGELPTKRVKLYAAAINVLIRTWNVEGFAPLNEEETLARLSYIAVAMMRQGKQRIGKRQLLKLLQEAQEELEAELIYAEVKPNEFIERVEYRSSLLMQTGHEEIDGELEEVYEFRHLTFQEYLAARGLVKEEYPGRDDEVELSELLAPYFEDELWREVIPLAAVLANRKSERLIRRLTDICTSINFSISGHVNDQHFKLLRQCILDEIQVREVTLRDALQQLARLASSEIFLGSFSLIKEGKFGTVFQEVAEEAFFGKADNWGCYHNLVREFAVQDFSGKTQSELSAEIIAKLDQAFFSGDRIQQGKAAIMIGWLIYSVDCGTGEEISLFKSRMEEILSEADEPLALCIAFALLWIGKKYGSNTQQSKRTILTLFKLWRKTCDPELRRIASRAFAEQPLLPRDSFDLISWGNCEDIFSSKAQQGDEVIQGKASVFILAWYRGQPWEDSELLEKLREHLLDKSLIYNSASEHSAVFRLLKALGKPGQKVLSEWRQTTK